MYCFNCQSKNNIQSCSGCGQLKFCSVECEFALFKRTHSQLCSSYQLNKEKLTQIIHKTVNGLLDDIASRRKEFDHPGRIYIEYEFSSICELLETSTITWKFMECGKELHCKHKHCADVHREINQKTDGYAVVVLKFPSLKYLQGIGTESGEIEVCRIKFD